MAIRLKSAARRSASRVPATRRKEVTPASRLRTRFRRTSPRVSARVSRTPVALGGSRSVSVLSVTLSISKSVVHRRITGAYIDSAILERWAAIKDGHLPPDWREDSDAPQVVSEAEVEETEAERLAEVEARGRQREETIREDAENERRMVHARADGLDDEADAVQVHDRSEASQLRRRATLLREQAEDEYRAAQQRMDTVADEVREEREEVRSELRRQVERGEEELAEYLSGLRAGLDGEVDRTVRARYLPDSTVEGWELA